LVQQFAGFDAKLRQYEEGEHFVEALLNEGGDALLAKVWSEKESLPSMDEIRDPTRWISRIQPVSDHVA
jgi:uncharacterized protein (DUF2342 family)